MGKVHKQPKNKHFPKCPSCGEIISDKTNDRKWLPFCSSRCKMIDLGKWLGEEYSVPGEPTDKPAKEED